MVACSFALRMSMKEFRHRAPTKNTLPGPLLGTDGRQHHMAAPTHIMIAELHGSGRSQGILATSLNGGKAAPGANHFATAQATLR